MQDYNISRIESKSILVVKHQKPIILSQSPFVILMSNKLCPPPFFRSKTLGLEQFLLLQ